MNKSIKPEMMWNLAIAGAAILFLLSIVAFVIPKPTAADASSKQRDAVRQLESKGQTAKASSESLAARNMPLLWREDPQVIGAKALKDVTRLARARNLKLTQFRPQRIEDGRDLRKLPFMILLEGSYPAVTSFLASLEQPATKLAVNSIQVSSTDGSSDAVTATIVVFAFKEISKDNGDK